jgi:hypothetical protein
MIRSGYDPNQPRAPKGEPNGGQWVSSSSSAVAASARRAAGLPADPKLVRTMIRALYEDEGFSLSLDAKSPETGYMTATKKEGEWKIRLEDVTEDGLQNYIEKYVKELAEPDMYLGGWVEDGWAYIDVSMNVQDLDEALRIAKGAEQIAIFDLSTYESIYVDYGEKKK